MRTSDTYTPTAAECDVRVTAHDYDDVAKVGTRTPMGTVMVGHAYEQCRRCSLEARTPIIRRRSDRELLNERYGCGTRSQFPPMTASLTTADGPRSSADNGSRP